MAVRERAVTMKMRWFAAVLLSSVVAHASDTFTKPTPEELSMASLPGFPNAPAVVLFREEITDDDLHVVNRNFAATYLSFFTLLPVRRRPPLLKYPPCRVWITSR
jgi:hypothetical protein